MSSFSCDHCREHELVHRHELRLFLHRFGGKLGIKPARPIYDKFLAYDERLLIPFSTIMAVGTVISSPGHAVLLRTDFIKSNARHPVKVRYFFLLRFSTQTTLISNG